MDTKQPLRDLLFAASLQDANLVRQILREGLDPNVTSNGVPLLMELIGYGHPEAIPPLIDAGADVNVTDQWGNSALARAIGWDDPKWSGVIAALRKAGATEAGTGQVKFMLACAHGRAEQAFEHLGSGAMVNGFGPGGMLGLVRAAGAGHAETVKMLLRENADVNLADIGGWTPLICAASCGHLDIVKLLVASGADVLAQQDPHSRSTTARGFAVQHRHYDIAKYLEEIESRLKRPSPYLGRRGVGSTSVNGRLLLIQASIEQATSAFAAQHQGRHERGVLGREFALEGRIYLSTQFKGHSWTVIGGLTRPTLMDPSEDWAAQLSDSMRRKTIYYGCGRTNNYLRYALYDNGQRSEWFEQADPVDLPHDGPSDVRHRRELLTSGKGQAFESSLRRVRHIGDVEKFVDRFLKAQDAYVPAIDTARANVGIRATLAWPEVDPADVERMDSVTLP